MTGLGIRSAGSSRILLPGVERFTLPSRLMTPDCVAAWDFYTTKDSTGNGHDLAFGAGASLLDAGGLTLKTGSTAYAEVAGLALPADFSFVCSINLSASTGAIFGTSADTATGFRLYTSTTAIFSKVGDDAGRASITTPTTGWVEIGVSVTAAGAITLCTETLSATGSDASPRGTAPARFGSQVFSTATAAGNSVIAAAALYNTAKSIADLRGLLVIAKDKRVKDGA